MQEQDRLNQTSWSQSDAMNWLAGNQGFTDEGERAAYWRIADEFRNQAILDLGVGTGRTTGYLRSLSANYTAIDYMPKMVELARRNYPFVSVEVGDARDLSRFADESFSLVVFSFMGLDAVDPEGRRRVLQEVFRVLKPKGMFWFSTFNKDGAFPQMRPWAPNWPRQGGLLTRTLLTLSVARNIPRATRNYWRTKSLRREGDGWLIAPLSSHCFGLLIHYTTLAYQCAELERAGFAPQPEVFSPNGAQVCASDDLRRVDHFNILARKP